MPDRIVRHSLRWLGGHQDVALLVLSFLLVVALGFAVAGWNAARNAEQRITRVELNDAAEAAAEAQAQKIAKVVTCFNAAKSRPLLTTALRALASRETDPSARAAFNALISNYREQPTPGIIGEPTAPKCRTLARNLGIDPTPYEVAG